MVDPQLQRRQANLFADKKSGDGGRGTTTLHPKITALSATTATVVDCAYSSAELLYATTGKPVPPVTPPENDGVRATLVLSGSTWKVSKQTVTEGTCRARLVIPAARSSWPRCACCSATGRAWAGDPGG